MRHFLLMGIYEDEGQRWSDSYDAENPALAENMAKAEYPGVTIAGVVELVNGVMMVVA